MTMPPNGHSPLTAQRAPLEALAAEVGADVARIERELRLQVAAELAELRAARAEHELRVRALEQRVIEQAAALALSPGPAGPAGPPGESIVGPPGPAGTFPAVSEWKARVHYVGAVVTYAGATWQAARDTGTEPGGDDWRLLAASGSDGRSLSFRGAWKGDKHYGCLDVCAYDGGSWVALQDAPGAIPGDGWQLIAARGRAGPQGPPGIQGERGYPGPPAPGIRGISIDEAGILTLTEADGTVHTADFYPLLIRHA